MTYSRLASAASHQRARSISTHPLHRTRSITAHPFPAISALAALVITLAALGPLACTTRQKPPAELVVTAFSPSEARTGDEPLELTFDKPVVTDAEVGVHTDTPPVALEPAVPVSAHWLDRQTLVITPKAPLVASTRYKVVLTGELGRRSGTFSFSFVHQPLVVEGIWGVDVEQLPAMPTLPLHFNQPVRAKDVYQHCRLQHKGSGERIALLAADDTQAETSEKVSVKPANELGKDTAYELVCESLSGAAGSVPLAQPFIAALHTYPELFVSQYTPAGTDVPADDVEIQLTFSTPVTLDAVRSHVSAKPSIPGLDDGYLDHSGKVYQTTVNLDTTTTYEIRVANELTDTFGQKLSRPFVMSFVTGNARPRLSVETGIYAVETSSPGYPIWTRNVTNVAVECAAVPKDKIVGLLTSALDYDPWYDADTDQSLDWKSLGLTKRDVPITIDKAKDNWHLTNLDLGTMCGGKPGSKPGLFLAELGSSEIKPQEEYEWSYRPHRRVLANVTDLGLLLKAGTASSLLWVASLSSGKPVEGASVVVYTPQGKAVHRGKTDASGILRMPGTAALLSQASAGNSDADDEYDYEEYDSYRSQRLIAVVEKGEDLAVIDGNWANGVQVWNFGVPSDREGGTTRIRGFIQSDRGIYRPGETVHFKGLVREIAAGKPPTVPRGAQVAIQVEDSRGQKQLDTRVRLSEFGGFAFDLPLGEEASLGDYYVRATVKDQVFSERFSVEEFRKASFEVKLSGTEALSRVGDKLDVLVDAQYLFGAPVANAAVEWIVQRRPHAVRFAGFEHYQFSDVGNQSWDYWSYEYGYSDGYLSYVTDGAGQTDSRGQLRLAVRDPRTDFDGPQDYVIGVTVRDESNQAISKSTVVTAHKTDFYLGLHTQEYVQAVDMPFAVNLVALLPGGERQATKATLRFLRQEHSCEYSGGYRSYASCKTSHAVALEREIDIPATGTATERIVPKTPGEYIVRVEAKDSRGNPVVSSDYVWVIGKGEAFWSGDESARMGLVASKPKYQPGETAKLVARTGMKNATALITVERDGILDAWVKELESGASGIEIPLDATHAPNVFAGVAMVTGRTGEGDRFRPQFKMGIAELTVSPEANRLEVVVEADKDTYQPGEPVSGVVRVLSGGQPVRAEVAVSVADEGVLQLIAYQTPDPMKAFFATWGLGVDPATTWNRIARVNDPTEGDPELGGDSGPGAEERVRSNFVSSAFWAPSLVTDERGEARFSFTAPDNLTAFRMMAVAADTGSRFGSGDRRITIKKPLMAKPALPRFLNAGDQATLGVIVHNYTGKAGTAQVSVQATGVSLGRGQETSTQSVAVAVDGTARVDVPIKVGKSNAQIAKTAKFAIAVQMDEHRDALEVSVPLHRPLVITGSTVANAIMGRAGAETATIPVAWNAPGLVANHSVLTVTVDRTGMGALEPSLRYLIEYPYGCLEQTLSRFIPLTKVKDLADSLDMEALEGAKLNGFIRAGVAKVARHQHGDGHFSLWPSGQTYPHLTVYALYGLSEAKRAGIKVPNEVIERGLAALKSWTASTQLAPGGDSGTMAMAAYVLSELGQPDPGLQTRLFEGRRALPRYGQALLVRAMHRGRARPQDIETVVSELASATVVDGETAQVRETMSGLDYYMSSDVRSSAIMLSALLEVAPTHELVEKLAAGLKKAQQAGGRWGNTQENLYSLVALADYARAEAAGTARVVLSISGKKEVTRVLKGASVLTVRRYLHNYKPGDVVIESSGKVHYSVRLSLASEEPAATAVEQGFRITRAYLDTRTNLPLEAGKPLLPGQLVKVRLEVHKAGGGRYVAVEDPLPAGFEAVNTALATEASTGGAVTDSSWSWTHTELRDDRVLAFVDSMYGNTMTLEYLARAMTPGTFAAPPARVEEMYSPEVNGRTAAATVVVAGPGKSQRKGK